MKVLGHEMRVFSYDDIFWAVDQIDNMNVIDLLLKVAKGGHKTFTKSVMFLEMTHAVPTGLGFPLKLKLKGSAVGSLELDGKFDIRNMFWGPSSMEIKGYVRPRYAMLIFIFSHHVVFRASLILLQGCYHHLLCIDRESKQPLPSQKAICFCFYGSLLRRFLCACSFTA